MAPNASYVFHDLLECRLALARLTRKNLSLAFVAVLLAMLEVAPKYPTHARLPVSPRKFAKRHQNTS